MRLYLDTYGFNGFHVFVSDLFYRENTDRVDLDLKKTVGALPVVAVDTRKPYEELELGRYAPGRHQWSAPYRSDWAIAAGEFSRERAKGPKRRAIETEAPSELSARSTDDGATMLVWVDNSEGESGFEVERARGEGITPGTFEIVATLPPGQTRFTDRAASAGATYWYRVRARTSRGAAAYTEARRVSSAERASLITELRPSNYGLTPLGVGERYYIDRAYTLASFPSVLDGGLLVRTANDDKRARGAFPVACDHASRNALRWFRPSRTTPSVLARRVGGRQEASRGRGRRDGVLRALPSRLSSRAHRARSEQCRRR